MEAAAGCRGSGGGSSVGFCNDCSVSRIIPRGVGGGGKGGRYESFSTWWCSEVQQRDTVVQFKPI